MADQETIFEDGENLQGAIAKALQQKKALLCFVGDDDDESTQWEAALLDQSIRSRLTSSTVALRLKAGSEQAGYLNAVCPVQACPAVIIIYNAQVVANYQHGQTSLEQLQQQLTTRYGTSTESNQASSSAKPVVTGYIDLPPSEGRMRLPNNAYDHFRKLTQQYISSGVSGKGLLHIQLRLLESLNIDVVTAAVKALREQPQTSMNPELPDEATNRLLNSPASKMTSNATPSNKSSTPSGGSSASTSSSAPTPSQETRTPQPASQPTPPQPPLASQSQARSQHNPPTPSPSSPSLESQRTAYTTSQKAAESERSRLKAQDTAAKRARRDASRQARDEAAASARRAALSDLRKANSTTADPKPTDVRLQVRLFDGATIRSSFAADATVARDVRPWIDAEVRTRGGAAAAGAQQQPYNLKLILTPLPTRQIEAGEEDGALSDIEGVKASATMVMVPVRGYVDSYSGGASGSGVTGAVQSVVGTGVGLVGSAVDMLFAGLGRLVGAGGAGPVPPPPPPPPQQRQQQGNASAERNDPAAPPGRSVNTGRVRTLADQRRDEDDARGAQLYNGMGLNVQPRKDDNGSKDD